MLQVKMNLYKNKQTNKSKKNESLNIIWLKINTDQLIIVY